MHAGLRLHDKDEDNDKLEADDRSLKSSPVQDNTSIPYADKKNIYTFKAFACVNPSHDNKKHKVTIRHISHNELWIENNSMPFPQQGKRLNDYTYLIL